MKYYSQTDTKWKNKTFGNPPQNFGLYGCLVTSISMFLETPPDKIMSKLTYERGANLQWASISNLPNTNFSWANHDTRDFKTIESNFKKGLKCLIEIPYLGASHWLALESVKNGKLICLDPYSARTGKTRVEIDKNQIKGSAFFKFNNQNDMINKQIIWDFTKNEHVNVPINGVSTKVKSAEVFDYDYDSLLASEQKQHTEGIRRMLKKALRYIYILEEEIRDLRNKTTIEPNNCDLENQRIEELQTELSLTINSNLESEKELKEQIEALQELNGKWARDFNTELEKAKKDLKPEKLEIQGLPIWKRQAYDFLRNGSVILGSFFALDSVSSLVMNFVNEGKFDQDSISNFGFGIVGLLFAYIQEEQKKNRKQNEKLEAINKLK